MTVSNSIFQQLCPACATSIPINAERCECGHDLRGNGSPLESTLRDEELYENYLAARTEQARESEQVAARALMEDPDNEELNAALVLAREVAASLDGDLASQRAKVQKLRSLMPAVSLPPVAPPRIEAAPTPAIQPASLPRKNTEINISIPVPLTPADATRPAEIAATPSAEAPAVILNPTPLKPPSAPERNTTPAVLATPTTVMHKAANALSALKQAKAREGAQQLAALRAQIARQKKAQQEKAERDAELQRQAELAASKPPATFREEQAARAERVVQEKIALSGKECPNCTAHIPHNTSRCQCGYVFTTQDTELPSLTLCTGDFTALRNTFISDLRGRR